MAGYIRQSAGLILTGNTIEASYFNDEYDALESAFSASTGHTHDGTTGGGAKIPPIGLAGLSSNGLIARITGSTFAPRAIGGPSSGLVITNGDGVAGNPTISLSDDLAALEGLAGTGITIRSATNTWSLRTLIAGANISIINPDGVAGDITIGVTGLGSIFQPFDADLSALAALGSTGLAARTGSNTWAQRSIQAGTNISVANGDGVLGNPTVSVSGIGSTIQGWDSDLQSISSLTVNGLMARVTAGSITTRELIAPAAGFVINNSDGILDDPTFVLTNDLLGLEGLSSTGFAVRTATDTWNVRSLIAPAAGLTIANNTGVGGNPTFALADDLASLEGLGTTGIAVRTGTSSWNTRTLTAGTGVTVSNGDGVSGNPTVATVNGSVLQTVGSGILTGSSTSSTTMVDVTGASQVITPSSTSHKVMLYVTWHSDVNLVAGFNTTVWVRVFRGATPISNEMAFFAHSATEGLTAGSQGAYVFLDSPASASAVTYKLQHRVNVGTATGTTAAITFVLQEIKA